jgi:SHS2 domain-containing protein
VTEPRWESLDHTSDLELLIRAQSEEELFANAALALTSLIVEVGDLRDAVERVVEISSESPEERFLDWLRELLYLVYTKGFLPRRVPGLELATRDDKYVLRASLSGDTLDAGRQRLLHEVKTVTYQEFLYGKEKGSWRARVVLDV